MKKQKLERAKRFGQETAETLEEKKKARALRFQLNKEEELRLLRKKRFSKT